jgi:cell division transport system permease protein
MANPAKAKKQLGYFKFGSVLFSTTLSLFIVGLFGIILIQASSLTKMIRENIEIQVFLDKGLSQKQKPPQQKRQRNLLTSLRSVSQPLK